MGYYTVNFDFISITRKPEKIKNRIFSGVYDNCRVLTDLYIYKYGMSYLFEILRTIVKQ